MKKTLLVTIFFLLSTAIASAEKQECTKLKLGKAYFECIKNKMGMDGSSSDNTVENNSGTKKGWYQKIKEGKPLFSK
jgi:hypothetical protein